MKKIICVGVLVILIFPLAVFAHPGRTDSSGCHYCRTNCSKWGLYNGQYHCHGMSINDYSDDIKDDKSGDNKIKAIYIDGESISISEDMEYETKREFVDIEVITNNKKATYSILNNDALSIGRNKIYIVVEAEDGSIQSYSIVINRLSDKQHVIEEKGFIERFLPYGIIGGISYLIYKRKRK